MSWPHENDIVPREGETQEQAENRHFRGVLLFVAGWILLVVLLGFLHDTFSGPVTAICQDGTQSHSQHHMGTCSWHGGVAQWMSP